MSHRAIAQIAGALDQLRAGLEALASAPDPDEWIDQARSPLGRRMHCELARRGALGGARKLAGRWLVRRRELDAYIEREGTPAAARADAEILAFRAARRGRKVGR